MGLAQWPSAGATYRGPYRASRPAPDPARGIFRPARRLDPITAYSLAHGLAQGLLATATPGCCCAAPVIAMLPRSPRLGCLASRGDCLRLLAPSIASHGKPATRPQAEPGAQAGTGRHAGGRNRGPKSGSGRAVCRQCQPGCRSVCTPNPYSDATLSFRGDGATPQPHSNPSNPSPGLTWQASASTLPTFALWSVPLLTPPCVRFNIHDQPAARSGRDQIPEPSSLRGAPVADRSLIHSPKPQTRTGVSVLAPTGGAPGTWALVAKCRLAAGNPFGLACRVACAAASPGGWPVRQRSMGCLPFGRSTNAEAS